MPRSDYRLALAVCVLAALARPAYAQATATYHLHNEASSTSGLMQLKTAGPDVARVAIKSDDLKNQAPGSQTIATFDTQAGVPNRGGVIPSGSTVTFTAWMKKTVAAGTVFPQLSLGLNFPVTTSLCQATGASALTTTLTAFTASCTTTSPIVMSTTTRLTVTAGFSMTVGPGKKSMKVALCIEGKLNGSADSRVVAPNPVVPAITSLTPNSGGVGTTITVTGANFGPTQDTSTLKFNGVTASPASWANGSITAPVPAGATTGPVVVTVGDGVASNGFTFTMSPPPSITSATPAIGRAGDAIMIDGTNFGAPQGSSTVRFNGTVAQPTSWSDTTIGVTVPAAASTGPIVVTVAGAASNGFAFIVAPSPSITSLTPASGHFADPVTINGTSFGSSQDSSAVTFNGTQAVVTGWSDNTITTSVPAGATTGPVVVLVSNQASSGATFVVDRGTGNGLLEITSPANGAVVAPGQTLTVTVSSPDNSTFLGVFLLAQNPIDDTGDAVDTLPAQFSLTIPSDIECRKYVVNAFGTTWTGERVVASIEIDVERPDMPLAVFPQLRQIIFEAEGEEASIDLSARFFDGSVVSVRESTNVTYASSDSNVATVDANGIVTAVAEGDADIVATYGPPEAGISATIPVSAPPSLLAAAPQPLDFGNQAVGTTSTQQMTVTNISDDALSITDVAMTGDYAGTDNCVASSPLAPGAFCSISVTFGPTAAGPRLGAVGIKSSFHIVPVAFKLTGTGVSQ